MSRAAGNFIQAYGEYTSELEAPESYHLWCALSILASAARRNIWVDQGMYTVYPNLYVILCAPPGKIGKSTCIRAAQGILTSVPDIIMGPDSQSMEELARFIASAGKDKTQSAVAIHSSELSSLIDTSGLKMIQFLTDIYDSPPSWKRRTKGSGHDTIEHPVLNILAGTTPSWISESLPVEATDHGFTSRTIFVYEENTRFSNPRPSAPNPTLVEALKTDLNHISLLEGEFTWTENAEKLYDKLYEKWRTHTPNDFRIAGYYNRKRTHVLKLAQLLRIAEDDDLVLDAREIDTANKLLEMIEREMPKTFQGVGKYEHTASLERILKQIHASGGIPAAEIFQRNYMVGHADDIDKIIRTLVKMKRVRIEVRGDAGEKQPWLIPVKGSRADLALAAD